MWEKLRKAQHPSPFFYMGFGTDRWFGLDVRTCFHASLRPQNRIRCIDICHLRIYLWGRRTKVTQNIYSVFPVSLNVLAFQVKYRQRLAIWRPWRFLTLGGTAWKVRAQIPSCVVSNFETPLGTSTNHCDGRRWNTPRSTVEVGVRPQHEVTSLFNQPVECVRCSPHHLISQRSTPVYLHFNPTDILDVAWMGPTVGTSPIEFDCLRRFHTEGAGRSRPADGG